jgi:hypothetical protein
VGEIQIGCLEACGAFLLNHAYFKLLCQQKVIFGRKGRLTDLTVLPAFVLNPEFYSINSILHSKI